MNCSTPGLPIHHQLLEFTQTHVHRVSDACIDHWGRLSYISLLFFGTLHSNGYIFPSVLCFLLVFFSHLFVSHFAFLHFFFLVMVLFPVSCTISQTSMKLTILCGATQDGLVMMERSGRCGPLEKGMANHFSTLALRTPWTVWKGKKIGHWKMNSPGQEVPNMLLKISREITPERMDGWSQSKNNTQLWMWLVIEARSDAVKSNIA